ncbi:MAG: prolipoprotein diacylglyceryl transferase [Candidatus Krumholzibacteriota bacterium]|nr:prolipoprotein diacylglyceryl transferase [Candidatus Krumholzibacteriota bacterium]
MHPILIELGRFKIYSYGFMLAMSFFVGILLASRRARKQGLDPDIIYDLSIILILGAVIGSRGLYILTHLDHFHGIIDVIALWQGGATYYGGLILAVAGAIVFLRVKKISFLKIADICSLSIASGVFLTRIGCFLSGCCFGSPTECSMGMVYPPDSPAGYTYPGIHIHPTQLYSSFYGLLIFVALLLLEKKKWFDGYTFGFMMILYGTARFIVDYFRFYEESAIVWRGFVDNQLISIVLVISGIVLLVVRGWQVRTGGQR